MKTRIKTDLHIAMKSGNTQKRDILRVLLGEIERHEQGRNAKIVLTDDEITSIIKKMVTNIKETEGKFTLEAEILTEYLPKMLTELNIVAIIQEVMLTENITSIKGMGIVMKHFSKNSPNQYDGKFVSDKIRNILA